MNNTNEPTQARGLDDRKIEYIQHDTPNALVATPDTYADDGNAHQGPSTPGTAFNFRVYSATSDAPFQGTQFQAITLDWKMRLLLMVVGSIVAVIVIGFAISAIIALVIAAALGTVVYGVRRLLN